jgi:hypothetical protein
MYVGGILSTLTFDCAVSQDFEKLVEHLKPRQIAVRKETHS